jgi:FtsP/CotA-like multicopper oxidase with cupredoxin domain
MSAKIAADRHRLAVSRRDGVRYAGALALGVAGWLFDAWPVRAQTGGNRSFVLEIRQGRVAAGKGTIRVTEGDLVELRWTTDEAVELHLHGYDIRLQLNPGTPETITFEAHTAGRFPVGIHGSGGQDLGSLLYLEVYPR